MEIRTGIKDEWIAPIAGGLNTAVQVSAMSLRELEGNFDKLSKKEYSSQRKEMDKLKRLFKRLNFKFSYNQDGLIWFNQFEGW